MSLLLYYIIFALFLIWFVRTEKRSLIYLLFAWPFLYTAYQFVALPSQSFNIILTTVLLFIVGSYCFTFYVIKTDKKNDQVYWSLWLSLLALLPTLELSLALFWISFLSTILYLIFQSRYDQVGLRNWMLLFFSTDLVYVLLSPNIFMLENYLLFSPHYIHHLETLFKYMVPVGLAMKIFGYAYSYLCQKRSSTLCLSELMFLVSLIFFRFSFNEIYGPDTWFVVSRYLFGLMIMLILCIALTRKVSFEAVLSLTILNVAYYICLISIHELSIISLSCLLFVPCIQKYIFKLKNYFGYAPLISLFMLIVLMLMATQIEDNLMHISFLLFVITHTIWTYQQSKAVNREVLCLQS